MKVKMEEIQRTCAAVGVQIDATGRVQIAEDAEQSEYVAKIHSLMSLEREVQIVARFGIGNLVRTMPGIEDGFLKQFCIHTFGEQLGKSAMIYQWVARHWPDNQNVGWGWTWYRKLARLPEPVKRQYVARWKAKKVKYSEMCEEIAVMLAPTPPIQIPAGISDNQSDSTCTQSSVYVESRDRALSFLACECSFEDAQAALVAVRSRFPFVEAADEEEE